MSLIFKRFIEIIFILLPLSIASGPFLADLSVTIIAIFFIIISFIKKEFKYFKNKIFLIIFIFWIYCFLNSLISENIFLSLESSLFYGRFIFFAVGISYILENNKINLKYFSISLVVSLSLIAIDAFIQGFFGTNILGFERPANDRVSGIFGEELILGSYLARLFPMSFLILPFLNTKNFDKFFLKNIIIIIFISLIGSAVFISGERTAFGIFCINLVLLLIFVIKNKSTKFFSIALIFMTIFLISFIKFDTYKRMIWLTIQSSYEEGYKMHDRLYIFSQKYESHYDVSLQMFLEKKIFGHGPKMFREVCKNYDEYGCSTHSHNTYMQLLAETGIIGTSIISIIFCLVIYYMIYTYLIKTHEHNENKKINKLILLITVFSNLFPFLPSGNFFGNWINSIYYLPLGILLYFVFKTKNTKCT